MVELFTKWAWSDANAFFELSQNQSNLLEALLVAKQLPGSVSSSHNHVHRESIPKTQSLGTESARIGYTGSTEEEEIKDAEIDGDHWSSLQSSHMPCFRLKTFEPVDAQCKGNYVQNPTEWEHRKRVYCDAECDQFPAWMWKNKITVWAHISSLQIRTIWIHLEKCSGEPILMFDFGCMSTLTVSQDFLAQSVHDALMLETFSPLPHFSCLYCDRDGQGNINEWSFVICFNDEGDGVKVTRRYSDAEVPLEDAAAPCEDLKTQGEEDLEKSELTRIRTPYVYECVRAKEPALADAAAATTGWSLMGGSIVAGPYRPCYHPYLAAETSKESAKETVSIAYVPRVKISEVRFYTWGYVQHIKSEGPAGSSVLACAITVHNVNRAQRFVRTQTEIRRRELEARRRGQQVGRTDTRRCDTETRRSETETRRRDTDTASPSLAPASPASTEATTIRVMLKRPPSDNFHLVVAADLSRVYLSCGGGIYSLPLAVVEVAPTESHTTSADAHGGCLDAQSPSREHGEGLHTSLNSVVHVELGRIKSLPGGPLTFDFQGDKLKSPGGICHIPCGAPLNAPIHTPGELASCTPNNGLISQSKLGYLLAQQTSLLAD